MAQFKIKKIMTLTDYLHLNTCLWYLFHESDRVMSILQRRISKNSISLRQIVHVTKKGPIYSSTRNEREKRLRVQKRA